MRGKAIAAVGAVSAAVAIASAQVGSGSGAGGGSGVAPHTKVHALGEGPDLGADADHAKSAGASAVESADVPAYQPSPPRLAVAPFENHSNQRANDWMIWGTPFELVEKSEAVANVTPADLPLFVGAAEVPADPGPVADFARAHDARYVMTGWFDRVATDQRIDVVLWEVVGQAGKTTVRIAAESQQQGPPAQYHKQVGAALADVWTKAKVLGAIDPPRQLALDRALAIDLYAVNLMGRGLGHLVTAIGMPPDPPKSATGPRATELKAAEHDLTRAVFVDPKCYEAQRLIGEYELVAGPGDPKAAGRAAGKFNYASDLAPEDIDSLRAAATASSAAGKWELATEQWKRVVTKKPWDLEARYQLGAAAWRAGEPAAAEGQLDQVVAHAPDHLPARRVLALIHASRSDTVKLVAELEAIAVRAPADLEVKADLASAYGSLGRWDKATARLEELAAARPADMALLVRVGDAHRAQADTDGALAWYARAWRVAPESSYPGFAAAQAAFDAGRLADANQRYTQLQRYKADLPAAEQALGVIALRQARPDDAAWYLRRATRESPRSLATWLALAAAEIARRDAGNARKVVDRARDYWPDDDDLAYLDAMTAILEGDRDAARAALLPAANANHALARTALAQLDGGGTPAPAFVPGLVRPWGDAVAFQGALDGLALTASTMTFARAQFQAAFLQMVGEAGYGPMARLGPGGAAVHPRQCPVSRMAPLWDSGQAALARYARLGEDLEESYRFIARLDGAGATAALLPAGRTAVAQAKKTYKLALADVSELRAEWSRVLGPELRALGCTDKLLAAAVADPARYHLVEEDPVVQPPQLVAPRARPRATFYVDNAECHDPVDVWIDGAVAGHVPPGRRSALTADAGERAMCLIAPGGAQCGDRGTVRQVYLHDGWRVTLHCPK